MAKRIDILFGSRIDESGAKKDIERIQTIFKSAGLKIVPQFDNTTLKEFQKNLKVTIDEATKLRTLTSSFTQGGIKYDISQRESSRGQWSKPVVSMDYEQSIDTVEKKLKSLYRTAIETQENINAAAKVGAATYQKQWEKSLSEIEAEIKSIKTQLGDPGFTQEMIADLASKGIEFKPSESTLSPERRYYLENELKAKEASLQSFKDANEVYKHQEEKLTSDMEILRNGGKLEEELEEEKVEEKVEEKTETKEEEKVPVEPIIPPAKIDTENLEPVKPEEEKAEENGIDAIIPPAKIDTEGLEPDEFPTLDGEENKNEEEDKDDILVTPIPVPGVIDTTGLEPTGSDDNTDGNDEEEKQEEEEEDDKKVVPVPVVEETYEKTSAKPGLWKKVGAMLVKAAAFISVLGTAIHTGLLLNQGQKQHAETIDAINRIGQIQVDEDKEQEEDEDKDLNQGETPSNGDDKVDTDSPNKGNNGGNGGNTNPSTPDPVTPDPTPVTPNPVTPDPVNPTPDPVTPDPVKPDPDPVKPDPVKPDPVTPDPDKEDDNMYLSPGDVAYNEKTGIYVDSEGNTYKINPDGTLTKLDDQELDKNNKGESIVGEDELNPEPPKEMPVIGNVTTGDDMTEDEIEAADDMINSDKSPEDLLDESVSEKNAEPATSEDYSKAEEDQKKYEEATKSELDSWWEEVTSKLDAVNDEEQTMHR